MAITLHNPDEEEPQRPVPRQQQPTQTTTGSARKNIETTDARGRHIVWRRLNSLEDFDLTEIAGANSDNQAWMARATIAFGVRSIDGEEVSRPANKNHLRAMIARLEEDGLTAILDKINELAEAEGGGVDRAKNSQGTPRSDEGSL